MLLLTIVIAIMGGSIIFYFGHVLIIVTESSLCSYGTVLRIRDVYLLCYVALCALCASYARAARCMRGKGIDFTYTLCRVPENSKPYPDLDPITTDHKNYINEDQPAADSDHNTKNNPSTNHNPITTEVNDHIIETLTPAVANSKPNPDLDTTTTEHKNDRNEDPPPADAACKCPHSIANIDSDFKNQPSSIMKDAKCAF